MSDPKAFAMFPPPVAAFLARAQGWFLALSRPARIMLLATTTVAVAIGGLVAFQRANAPFAPLFTQLDRDDASAIVTKLKELKVPYRISGDGTTIEVAESKTHELRLELAGG